MESSADRIFLSPASSSLGSQALAYSLIPSHPLRRRKAVTSLVKKSTCMVSAITRDAANCRAVFFFSNDKRGWLHLFKKPPGFSWLGVDRLPTFSPSVTVMRYRSGGRPNPFPARLCPIFSMGTPGSSSFSLRTRESFPHPHYPWFELGAMLSAPVQQRLSATVNLIYYRYSVQRPPTLLTAPTGDQFIRVPSWFRLATGSRGKSDTCAPLGIKLRSPSN